MPQVLDSLTVRTMTMDSENHNQESSTPAPATAALRFMQQSGWLTNFTSSAPHGDTEEGHPEALPITVTATSELSNPLGLNSNVHNHRTGEVRPSKQLHPPGVGVKRSSGLLTVPTKLACSGGGITLGSVAVPWPTPGGKNLSTTAGGYSAASRATVHGMKHSTGNDSQKTVHGLSGKRVSSEPIVSLTTSSTKPCAKYKYRKVIGGKIPRSISMSLPTEMSPQLMLDKMIQARGYSTQNFSSLEGAYYCKPTPLQIASYGLKTVHSVRSSDGETLSRMLDLGLSPNPCNTFGESIVHMVCRRADTKLLKILLDKGCSLQVTDDFGRTPLHDACWTAQPNFELVDLLLEADERLLHIVDCRGSSPLSYVNKDHWKQWIEFFQARVDRYWSPRDVTKDGEEGPPARVGEPPHSRPIPDPQNAATIEQASLISSGKLNVHDALRQRTIRSAKSTGEEVRVPMAAPAAC